MHSQNNLFWSGFTHTDNYLHRQVSLIPIIQSATHYVYKESFFIVLCETVIELVI